MTTKIIPLFTSGQIADFWSHVEKTTVVGYGMAAKAREDMGISISRSKDGARIVFHGYYIMAQ